MGLQYEKIYIQHTVNVAAANFNQSQTHTMHRSWFLKFMQACTHFRSHFDHLSCAWLCTTHPIKGFYTLCNQNSECSWETSLVESWSANNEHYWKRFELFWSCTSCIILAALLWWTFQECSQLGLLNEKTNLTKEKQTPRYDTYSTKPILIICVTLMHAKKVTALFYRAGQPALEYLNW